MAGHLDLTTWYNEQGQFCEYEIWSFTDEGQLSGGITCKEDKLAEMLERHVCGPGIRKFRLVRGPPPEESTSRPKYEARYPLDKNTLKIIEQVKSIFPEGYIEVIHPRKSPKNS